VLAKPLAVFVDQAAEDLPALDAGGGIDDS
jgi:hypothetical protein